MNRPVGDLPVRELLPRLGRTLEHHATVILTGAPGSGKTTLVPPALADQPWLGGDRIILLEPRRLAARAAAAFMARQRGEEVGQSVGYRVRFDHRVSPATRIEVMTEGVLIRLLQRDPSLDGVGLVIFDEFHQRSLETDLALALCLDARAGLREDLRLLFMSATLAVDPLADFLDAPCLHAGGRVFPVTVRHLPPPANEDTSRPDHIGRHCARTIGLALREEEGDILAFLPGRREIGLCASMLGERPGVRILPLHGSLDLSEQDRIIRPDPDGARRVILSTSISETSLTIEGIGVVVDSGWQRVHRFDPGRGLGGRTTIRVARAAAEQRASRAGRTGPGVCYRAYARGLESTLTAFDQPEIRQADLSGLVLELALWGVAGPEELRWLTPPPASQVKAARQLLTFLGALDHGGRITTRGRAMARLPVHPRLAAMLLAAAEPEEQQLTASLAALISEPAWHDRDSADLERRLADLDKNRRQGGVRRARDQILRLLRHRPDTPAATRPESVGGWLSLAYPDRIGGLRPGSTRGYRLVNGRGASLDRHDPLRGAPFLCVAEMDGVGRTGRIYSAASLDRDELMRLHPPRTDLRVWFDRERGKVRAENRWRLGRLTIAASPAPPEPDQAVAVLLAAIREEPDLLTMDESVDQLRLRCRFLARIYPEEGWPDLSWSALEPELENWLGPWLTGIGSREQLAGLDLAAILGQRLGYERGKRLAREAPQRLRVPSGSRLGLRYQEEGPPVLAVRPQELYGLDRTPTVSSLRIPVRLHLLSPAGRPIQITDDLAGFWRGSYREVRKEMRGRYPKHYWPEDPLTATPTAGVRPRD